MLTPPKIEAYWWDIYRCILAASSNQPIWDMGMWRAQHGQWASWTAHKEVCLQVDNIILIGLWEPWADSDQNWHFTWSCWLNQLCTYWCWLVDGFCSLDLNFPFPILCWPAHNTNTVVCAIVHTHDGHDEYHDNDNSDQWHIRSSNNICPISLDTWCISPGLLMILFRSITDICYKYHYQYWTEKVLASISIVRYRYFQCW